MGYLASSTLSEANLTSDGYTCRMPVSTQETPYHDAFGNIVAAVMQRANFDDCNPSESSGNSIYSYEPVTGRLRSIQAANASSVDSLEYDESGNTIFWHTRKTPAESRASYYDAEERVRAQDWRSIGDGTALEGTFH